MTSKTPKDQGNAPDRNAGAVPLGTTVVDAYRVLELINLGGMGEVYRGENIDTGEPVAIKIILPELANDPQISALFQKEAQVLGGLDHDGIVRHLVFRRDPALNRSVLVMEHVNGCRLGDLIDQNPLSEQDVRKLLRRLADALGRAHEAGTVHRDLTPYNILLPENSVHGAKIIDFGIAKTTTAGSQALLQGKFAGTVHFVSPEQLGDHGGIVDGRSDIYALGLLAAACCRGQILNMGSSVVEAVDARRTTPDISDVYPSLRPILTAMLAPNPENRPQSMAEVIALLDADPNELASVLPDAKEQQSAPQSAETAHTPVAPNLKTAPPRSVDISIESDRGLDTSTQSPQPRERKSSYQPILWTIGVLLVVLVIFSAVLNG